MPHNALIVEDEAIIALALKLQLIERGFDVVSTVTNGPAAIRAYEQHKPDLVLMDVQLQGGMDGCETARLLTERFGAKIVYVTGQGDVATRQQVMRVCPAPYLVKPFSPEQLGQAISAALPAAGGCTHP